MKPENILIDQWGHLKLTDFGLSKENFSKEDLAKTVCGSPEYFCPEILQDQTYGRTLDFYSLGVLLYELVTGLPPFYSQDQFQMQKDIVTKAPRVGHLSTDIQDLINSLLHKNPEDRLGAKNGISDIKKHKYFQDLNWSYVKRMQFKYDKQEFMKLDMAVSHFSPEYQQFKDSPDNCFDIGIDIREECGEEINQERLKILKKQRSKSQQRILCTSTSEMRADYYKTTKPNNHIKAGDGMLPSNEPGTNIKK